jgi:hypothetical protein
MQTINSQRVEQIDVNSHPKEKHIYLSQRSHLIGLGPHKTTPDERRNRAYSKLFLPGTEQLFLLHHEQSLPAHVPTPDPRLSIMAPQPPFPISSLTRIHPTSSPIFSSSAHLPSLPQRPPPHSGVVGRPPRRPPPVSRWTGGGDPGEHPWSNAASRGRGGIRERWDSLDPAMTGLPQFSSGQDPSKWRC